MAWYNKQKNKEKHITKHQDKMAQDMEEVDSFLTPKVDVAKSMKANKIVY